MITWTLCVLKFWCIGIWCFYIYIIYSVDTFLRDIFKWLFMNRQRFKFDKRSNNWCDWAIYQQQFGPTPVYFGLGAIWFGCVKFSWVVNQLVVGIIWCTCTYLVLIYKVESRKLCSDLCKTCQTRQSTYFRLDNMVLWVLVNVYLHRLSKIYFNNDCM